jgi:hypothetical protein
MGGHWGTYNEPARLTFRVGRIPNHRAQTGSPERLNSVLLSQSEHIWQRCDLCSSRLCASPE